MFLSTFVYDRQPPQNANAERAVLGACLLEQEALNVAVDLLLPEDFYDLSHRAVFEIVLEMVAAGRPVDLITFSEELVKRGTFEKLGGQGFVASLIAEVPTTANVEYHASIVRAKSTRRRLIEAGNHVVRMGYAQDVEDGIAVDESERAVFEVTQNRHKTDVRSLNTLLHEAFDTIRSRYERSGSHVSGFETGLADLDRMTGGFQPGSLNIIAARPSMGKTALALNMAQFGGGNAKDPVLIFSLEMSSEQLVTRMLGAEAQINVQFLHSGSLNRTEWDELALAAGRLSKLPLFIDDSSMLTVMEFRARCRRFKAKHGRLGLIVIDYLQLMSGGGRFLDNKQQEVAEISRMLKGVARELQCPVIALSQLSRAVESRRGEKKPILSDLRDSGAIEQDADTVMLLYRKDYYEATLPDSDQVSEASLNLAKNRNGATGEVPLVFVRRFTRFFSKKEM